MFSWRNILKCSLFLAYSSALTAAPVKNTDEVIFKQWPGNAKVNIPTVRTAPVIDGIFSPGEWDNAAQISGFSLLSGNYVTSGTGSLRLMRDKNFLYLAVRTTTPNNDPGGSLVANALSHDGKVFQDDSLDFMLIPDRAPEKLYHWIINSRDTVYDRLADSSGKSDVSWNFRNLRSRSHVDKGYWDMEIALPLAEIDAPAKFLKINVGRNWSTAGSSLLNPAAKYFDSKRMLTVNWKHDYGTLRQLDPGDIGRGEWKFALEADNPSRTPLRLAVQLRHNIYTKKDGKQIKTVHRDFFKEVTVAPGKSAAIDGFCMVDGKGRYHYTAVLFDPASGKVHGSRTFSGTRGTTERHPRTLDFTIKNIGTGECRYYPGYDKAVLIFRPQNRKISDACLILPDGKHIAGVPEQRHIRFTFPVPAAPGKHHFALDFDGHRYDNAFQLEKRSFPWLNSSLGKDKIVLPPFKPLTADGPALHLAHSEIELNATGVWEKFSAENIPMLAAPMRFETVVNGKKEYFSGSIQTPSVDADGYALNHEFAAETASKVRLSGVSNVEYDGFQYLNFTLSAPANTRVERLTLIIPLRDREVPFFHAVSNFIRENPSGRIPAGEGMVWNGSKLPRRTALGQETLHPQVVPYLWAGGVSRGMACFLESTYGFALDRKNPAVRLIRKNDVLYVELDIINKPVTLNTPRAFAFGMMPTPVKKIDPAMRQYTHDSSGIGARSMKNFTFIGGQLMGFTPWRHEPFAGDFEIFRAACRAVRAGGSDDMAKELDHWLDKYEKQVIAQMKQVPNAGEYPMHYSRVRKNFRKFQLQNPARRPALPYKYTDPKLTWIFEDIPEYFRAEWYNPSPQNYFGARRISMIPSSIDYMVYCLDQELRNGAHGIYLDDMYLMPDTNTETVAKIDADGVVHPAMGILGMRELVKRISVLQHKYNLYPRLLQIHMTNALLVPCFSLATSTLGWEKNYGETPLPERFSVDDILATGTGLQLGTENCVLGGIKRRKSTGKAWKLKYRYLTRTLIALSLPFNAKFKAPVTPAGDAEFYFSIISLAGDFGYWKPECRFVPFWEADAAALQVNNSKVLASSWRFPGRVLLVLGSQSDKEQHLQLTVDRKELQLPDSYKIINAETRQVESAEKIVLPPYDFKLLILE